MFTYTHLFWYSTLIYLILSYLSILVKSSNFILLEEFIANEKFTLNIYLTIFYCQFGLVNGQNSTKTLISSFY